MVNRWAGLAALLLACFCVGCIGTSEPFKVTAAAAGPVLAQSVADYTAADKALDTAQKSDQYGAAEEMAHATATRAAVDYSRTAAAWARLRPVFFRYTDRDAGLSVSAGPGQPLFREIIQGPAFQLDEAIRLESQRRAKWFPPPAAAAASQ